MLLQSGWVMEGHRIYLMSPAGLSMPVGALNVPVADVCSSDSAQLKLAWNLRVRYRILKMPQTRGTPESGDV